MGQVRIVTDSSAHLPDADMIAGLGIEVIPLAARVGQRAYPERVNQLDETFLRKMAQDSSNVSVSAPSTRQMQALFSRLSQVTDSVVCIHASSALHDTAEVARRAAAGYMGRQRIIVLDTLTTSVGLGLIVEAAAVAAAQGAAQADVVKLVRSMIPRMYALFFSNSLAYLEHWGRLSPAQTLLGAMLDLKPLATMEDGNFIPVEKVRHPERAVEKLYDFVFEFSRIEQLYLVQHGFESEAAQLLERLEVTFPHRDFPVIGYPPSLAVHIGPKALGVMVYESAD